jgi:hypothetical protein
VKALRLLVALVVACCVCSAHALIPKVSYEYRVGSTTVWQTTQDAACQAYPGYQNPLDATYVWTYLSTQVYSVSSGVCHFRTNQKSTGAISNADAQASVSARSVTPYCPVGTSVSGASCACNAGTDEVGGQCVPHVNACTPKTGKVGVTNWTQGFTRTSNEGDVQGVGPVNRPPTDGVVCDAGCTVSIQMAGPGVQYYASQSPTADGLYRRSVDYPNIGLGSECTAQSKDSGAQKTTAAPPCPGTVGEVNGKTTCVGTPAKPVTTTPTDVPPAPPIAGNPSAGAKPSTGDGSGTGSSGRTPGTGDGGNAGGPAAAGVGGVGGGAGGTAAGGDGSGSGTTTKPADGKEQTACGAPGQPVCAVKVDEKGTPETAGTSFDEAKAKMEETKGKTDEQLTKAAGTGDKGFFEPIRSLFWAPPVAACETFDLPQQVGGLKLDACGVVDGVRNAMALVWAGTGLFLCFGMIKRSF